MSIEDIVLEDSHFSMTASQGGDSGTAFRRSSYEIEGEALYVTLFSGLARGGLDADRMRVDIREEGVGAVRQVYLRDGSAVKFIYSR